MMEKISKLSEYFKLFALVMAFLLLCASGKETFPKETWVLFKILFLKFTFAALVYDGKSQCFQN